MPQGGERAEVRDPPPMDRALSKAKEQAAAPGSNWPQDEWWRQLIEEIRQTERTKGCPP